MLLSDHHLVVSHDHSLHLLAPPLCAFYPLRHLGDDTLVLPRALLLPGECLPKSLHPLAPGRLVLPELRLEFVLQGEEACLVLGFVGLLKLVFGLGELCFAGTMLG